MQKLIVSILLLTAVFVAPARGGEDDTVPIFRLKGPVSDQPDTSGISELLGDKAPVSMFDLLEKLRTIRGDESVPAVVFDIDEAALGLGQIQELRTQLEALRAADKDVWIFTEGLNLRTLLLGASASNLVLLPTGDVAIAGLYGEASYYKNMLDKIGVEADIIHCGEYKSAGEPFYRTGPSEAELRQTNELLDSIFNEIIEDVAKSRRISADDVRDLIDRGMLTPQAALDAKLVDKLAYREDFIKTLKRRYGSDTKFSRSYGKKKGPQLDLDNPFGVFKLFSEMMKGPTESDKPAIAVVFVEGMITTGATEDGLFGGASNAGSTTVRKAIAEAAADENVKALVLRVNSPGGSAVASDIICEATNRFKKSGRPFIVSMGNVAASGGYYVSALADQIFADPGTITGSIGVVGGKIVTKELWDWVGITGHEYKRGKHADLMNTNRRFTDEERNLVTSWMVRVYDDFKGRVKEGRADRIKGEVEPLAGGRVYTGKKALDIGLVDRLGGFADALKYAASEAELGGDFEIRVFPPPKTLMDFLTEAFGGKESDDEFVFATAGRGAPGFAALPHVAAAMEAVSAVDPAKARAMREFFIQLELLSGERVLLVGPACTFINP